MESPMKNMAYWKTKNAPLKQVTSSVQDKTRTQKPKEVSVKKGYLGGWKNRQKDLAYEDYRFMKKSFPSSKIEFNDEYVKDFYERNY